MNIKNNLPLIFGISIPLLMIIFVALSIYLPQIFVKPQYDFLYLSGDNDCYVQQKYIRVYTVENSELIYNQECSSAEPKIFFYSIENNESKEIVFEEAKRLDLNEQIQSPDGFEIVYGSKEGGFFPFFFYSGSDYSSRYIKGHNVSKKLNIQFIGYNNFVFLGWVKK